MALDDNVQTIELKRVVMVKAIVTEAFKENLVKELERAIQKVDTQMQQMELQAKKQAAELKKKGLSQQLTAFKHQYEQEKNRLLASKADLTKKIEQAKTLQLGSQFVQGPIEGPVSVTVGDNLYKKVGAAELIVKDGVIQEIHAV